jgi:hypothetical protein
MTPKCIYDFTLSDSRASLSDSRANPFDSKRSLYDCQVSLNNCWVNFDDSMLMVSLHDRKVSLCDISVNYKTPG